MQGKLVCWKCGASLRDIPLPISRRAECLACGIELHVCRLCEFYDARVAGNCREDRAEEVNDKERANFCDYFSPCPSAYQTRDLARAQAARAQLEELFGIGSGDSTASAGAELRTNADAAREELEKLFGIDKKDESSN